MEFRDFMLNKVYINESVKKGDFVAGEKGGEPYFDLPNDYTYDDARQWFCDAVVGKKNLDLDAIWENYISAARKHQFERTYNKFEKYKQGKSIKLYRGIVLNGNSEVELDKPGECWSFSSKKAMDWANDIWDKMVYDHIVSNSEIEDCDKVILFGETTLDNCRLPYSIWLAGRFERPEWEVRVKDESKVKIIKTMKLD